MYFLWSKCIYFSVRKINRRSIEKVTLGHVIYPMYVTYKKNNAIILSRVSQVPLLLLVQCLQVWKFLMSIKAHVFGKKTGYTTHLLQTLKVITFYFHCILTLYSIFRFFFNREQTF